jgi:hypothetical protein
MYVNHILYSLEIFVVAISLTNLQTCSLWYQFINDSNILQHICFIQFEYTCILADAWLLYGELITASLYTLFFVLLFSDVDFFGVKQYGEQTLTLQFYHHLTVLYNSLPWTLIYIWSSLNYHWNHCNHHFKFMVSVI